jgi:hypothetical protein
MGGQDACRTLRLKFPGQRVMRRGRVSKSGVWCSMRMIRQSEVVKTLRCLSRVYSSLCGVSDAHADYRRVIAQVNEKGVGRSKFGKW